jgi:hypothetical protein
VFASFAAEDVPFNLGRGAGGFRALVVWAWPRLNSFTLAIALLATIYLIDILAPAFPIPEKKGLPLG